MSSKTLDKLEKSSRVLLGAKYQLYYIRYNENDRNEILKLIDDIAKQTTRLDNFFNKGY